MSVLVIAEHDNITLNHATRSVVSAATQIGGGVDILVAGSGSQAVTDQAASVAGVSKVIHVDDAAAAQAIGRRLHTGTVFMNRCDYLDPELAWVGVRDSGRGCTLSRYGFDGFTRFKSLHLRHVIP